MKEWSSWAFWPFLMGLVLLLGGLTYDYFRPEELFLEGEALTELISIVNSYPERELIAIFFFLFFMLISYGYWYMRALTIHQYWGIFHLLGTFGVGVFSLVMAGYSLSSWAYQEYTIYLLVLSQIPFLAVLISQQSVQKLAKEYYKYAFIPYVLLILYLVAYLWPSIFLSKLFIKEEYLNGTAYPYSLEYIFFFLFFISYFLFISYYYAQLRKGFIQHSFYFIHLMSSWLFIFLFEPLVTMYWEGRIEILPRYYRFDSFQYYYGFERIYGLDYYAYYILLIALFLFGQYCFYLLWKQRNKEF